MLYTPVAAAIAVRMAAPFPRFFSWTIRLIRVSGREAAKARITSTDPSLDPSSTIISSRSIPSGRGAARTRSRRAPTNSSSLNTGMRMDRTGAFMRALGNHTLCAARFGAFIARVIDRAYLVLVFYARLGVPVAEGRRRKTLGDFLSVAVDPVAGEILFGIPLPYELDTAGTGYRRESRRHSRGKSIYRFDRRDVRKIAFGVPGVDLLIGLHHILIGVSVFNRIVRIGRLGGSADLAPVGVAPQSAEDAELGRSGVPLQMYGIGRIGRGERFGLG